MELASLLNGGRDSLGSSRTCRFFSMIAAYVVWYPNCSLPCLRASSVRVSTRVRNWVLAFSPSLIPRRRLAAGWVESKFRYVPVRVYTRYVLNLLKDPNSLQFIRPADDLLSLVGNKALYLKCNAVAIGPVTGRPFPWLLVRQLVTCNAQIASANQIIDIRRTGLETRTGSCRSFERITCVFGNKMASVSN